MARWYCMASLAKNHRIDQCKANWGKSSDDYQKICQMIDSTLSDVRENSEWWLELQLESENI